ncbi:Hypothetical protein PFR_JS20-2_2327 [Propionibacterium freudenreichii]|nr:Hypothetical protein PFR_JS20-1_2319 [Propionibacterium freudenreichii]SCQ83553.1 Hypothetical protein PFR_JS20-2_2327 [Propionibacterium freudenreichii]
MGEDPLTRFLNSFDDCVCNLRHSHRCGVECQESGKQWRVGGHFIFRHAMPDGKDYAAPGIDLLRKKGIEFRLCPLLREETRRENHDAELSTSDSLLDFLSYALPNLYLHLVEPDNEATIFKRLSKRPSNLFLVFARMGEEDVALCCGHRLSWRRGPYTWNACELCVGSCGGLPYRGQRAFHLNALLLLVLRLKVSDLLLGRRGFLLRIRTLAFSSISGPVRGFSLAELGTNRRA